MAASIPILIYMGNNAAKALPETPQIPNLQIRGLRSKFELYRRLVELYIFYKKVLELLWPKIAARAWLQALCI